MTQWDDGMIESPAERLQRLLDEKDREDVYDLQWSDALCILGAIIGLLLLISVTC